jgi:ubiquinone/menaquinone biosynthesis C-methylase UbiE
MKEEVTSTYETWYEGKYKRADLLEKSVLKDGIEWIGGVETILEVGCGSGHFSRFFEGELGIETFGADISPYMLKEAKKRSAGDRLVRSTSSHLPFQKQSVDAVGFVTCFEYMRGPLDVMVEAGRVARRGIFFGLMNSWSVPTVRRKVQLAIGKNEYYKNAHFYSLTQMGGLIRKAFGKTGVQTMQRSTVFPRPLPVAKSWVPLGAFLCVSVRFKE